MPERTVVFDRIGRHHDPEPIVLAAALVEPDTPDRAARLIFAAVYSRLGSRDVDVCVDGGDVLILVGGFRNAGHGRIEPPYEEEEVADA